jgi:hypothetical protein
MKRTIAVIAAAAVLGLAGSLLTGTARAITDTEFKYSTVQKGYLMVMAAALTPSASAPIFSNAGFNLSTGQAGSHCFYAPVNLPHRAHLTTLRAKYKRTANGNEIYIILRQASFDDIVVSNIANKTVQQPPVTGMDVGTVSYDVDPAAAAVKNHLFGYYLTVCITPDTVFYMARIEYTYQTAGE